MWYYQLFFFQTAGCLNGLSIGMTQTVLYYRYVFKKPKNNIVDWYAIISFWTVSERKNINYPILILETKIFPKYMYICNYIEVIFLYITFSPSVQIWRNRPQSDEGTKVNCLLTNCEYWTLFSNIKFIYTEKTRRVIYTTGIQNVNIAF